MFEVKTPQFQGPLELLLELIEKRKLFVNDISLSEIADDYILYIRENEDIPLEHVTHFINIASILLLIKSRSLLPNLELTDEEEESIEDLEERLRMLKEMKELSGYVERRFGRDLIFLPEDSRDPEAVFSPHESISTKNLLEAAKSIISTFPKFRKEEGPRTKVRKVISLDEMIESLTKRIKSAAKMSFSDFRKGTKSRDRKEDRINTVIGFLAILELFKQGIVNLVQDREFSDIEIESTEISVPRY